MTKIAKTLDWTDIDPTQLPRQAQEAFADYKTAYRAMKAAKEHFEQTARAGIPTPEGKVVRFGYNFGKLAIALDDASAAKASAKPKLDLSAWIAAQQAAGARH